MKPEPEFWTLQNETGAIARLLSQLERGLVYADPAFARLAATLSPPPGCQIVVFDPAAGEIEALAQNDGRDDGRDVFLFCVTPYARHAARLAALCAEAGARFVDWPHEIFPALVGYNQSWRLTDAQIAAPRRRYGVISTARSGSTYLAELLYANGLGQPKEHIRKPFAELVRRRADFGLDLARLARRLEGACAHNGVFGSKIISGFLWPILDLLSAPEQAALFGAWWENPLVYLVRESKVDQAVSDFVANATKTWHVRKPGDLAAYREALKSVKFDFDVINNRFLAYVRDERKLRAFLGAAPQVRQVRFDDLVRDPAGELRAICAHVAPGEPLGDLATASELIKTASPTHRALIDAFVRDARARKLSDDRIDDPLFAELK